MGDGNRFTLQQIENWEAIEYACRYRKTIFQNEENGYTIAVFTTKDASVPLAARDKYLQGQNVIGLPP